MTNRRHQVILAGFAIVCTFMAAAITFLGVDLVEGRTAAGPFAVVIALIVAGSFLYAYIRA